MRKIFLNQIRIKQNFKNNFKFANVSPFNQLNDRESLYQYSSELLKSEDFIKKIDLNQQIVSAYCGFDPTSDCLHMGNLISIISLIRLGQIGLQPIFLIGGATGMIGDPSGKTSERQLLDKSQVQKNIDGIEQTIQKTVKNILNYLQVNQEELQIKYKDISYQIVNNHVFYENMNVIEYIRDIGKFFRMSVLLSKDTVANRLQSQDGISYTEFSYQILQAYDFHKLNQSHNCMIQIGGSDQWGNMTNGCDFVRKIQKKEVFCMTTPLLMSTSGQKFGKSEGNALWLDQSKTKSYDIHQYLLNAADSQVETYLKMLTFQPLTKIRSVMEEQKKSPELRVAQKLLADSIVSMLHNESQSLVSTQGELFFKTDFVSFKQKSQEEIQAFFSNFKDDKLVIKQQQFDDFRNFVDLLYFLEVKTTKKEIKRIISEGGMSLNGIKLDLDDTSQIQVIKQKYFFYNQYSVLRVGKKKFNLIEIIQ